MFRNNIKTILEKDHDWKIPKEMCVKVKPQEHIHCPDCGKVIKEYHKLSHPPYCDNCVYELTGIE